MRINIYKNVVSLIENKNVEFSLANNQNSTDEIKDINLPKKIGFFSEKIQLIKSKKNNSIIIFTFGGELIDLGYNIKSYAYVYNSSDDINKFNDIVCFDTIKKIKTDWFLISYLDSCITGPVN